MSTHSLHAARFLRMQPWFAQLAPALQEQAIRNCSVVRTRKGDVALPAGETPRGWYAVLTGFVKLQTPAPDDNVAAYLALTGGEWFGEGSLLKKEPRRYEVVALRDSELLCLPAATFHELLSASLPFSHAVLHHMNLRLGQAMAIIEANRSGSLEQRVALYLGPLFWHGLRTLNLSQEELGTLAGMSRQSTNKALSSLQTQGLITLRAGRVVATNADALGDFAGMSQRRWDQAIAA